MGLFFSPQPTSMTVCTNQVRALCSLPQQPACAVDSRAHLSHFREVRLLDTGPGHQKVSDRDLNETEAFTEFDVLSDLRLLTGRNKRHKIHPPVTKTSTVPKTNPSVSRLAYSLTVLPLKHALHLVVQKGRSCQNIKQMLSWLLLDFYSICSSLRKA